MSRTHWPAALSVLTLSVAVAAPVPWQLNNPNLIENGSFEDGPKCDLLTSLAEGSTAITGWTVTRGPIDYVGSFWEHADGKRSLDLHGSPGFGGVKQTIKTTPGAKYKLTFRFATTPHAAKPKKKLAVEVDGAKTEFEVDASGKSTMVWERQSLTFTAGPKDTVIEFYTLETEDGNCGPAIDDVKVVRTK
ncbi:MAG: choice-of-anchor C family protein [Fimbriiglobus sp.]|jgi:choice-of-anchor C domain-containing protein|nr:choice-of-anchor C family protein [Fimbriiglobus sp.]